MGFSMKQINAAVRAIRACPVPLDRTAYTPEFEHGIYPAVVADVGPMPLQDVWRLCQHVRKLGRVGPIHRRRREMGDAA